MPMHALLCRCLCCLFWVASATSWCHGGDPKAPADRSVAITLKGQPASPGRALVRAIRVADGTVVTHASAQVGQGGAAEVLLDVPAEPLLVAATFMTSPGSKGPQLWEGSLVLGAQEASAVLPMRFPEAGGPSPLPSKAGRGLTYKPPARGKAIGYERDAIKISSETLKGAQRFLAQFMVVDLVNGPCKAGTGDEALYILECEKRAEVEAELALQQSPYVDPSTRGTPQLLAPTHTASGSVVEADGRITFSFEIRDLQGALLAAGSAAGATQDWAMVAEKAMAALNQDLCGGEEGWSGTVTYQANTSLTVPNVDPRKPGASISGNTSFTASFTPNSFSATASYQSTVTGAEGTATTSGSGAVETSVSVSEVDGRVIVEIGRFSLPCIASASMPGGGGSGRETIQLGGWRGEAPAKSRSATQSGSWNESSPEGRCTLTWTVTRRSPKGRQ